MDAKYEIYKHHEKEVAVRSDLKGKHWDYCLCRECIHFAPNTEDNCPIAQQLYRFCVDHNLVTPVWECPKFSLKAE